MRVSRNATTEVPWPLVGLVVLLAAATALGIIAYRKRHSKRNEPEPQTEATQESVSRQS
jgi:hypothetical protein